MKLSTAQIRIMGQIAATGTTQGGTNPWRTVRALIKRGLVTHVQNRTSPSDPQYALTEEGNTQWKASEVV